MSILFKNAKIMETKDGRLNVLENAFLGVDGDIIDYIGTEKPQKTYDQEKDMYGKLLMPGLNNCHGHTAMNLLRGIGSDLPLMDWLHKMWPIEDRLRPQDCLAGMEMAILEMLACGTTSFCDMYLFPKDICHCIGESGIKANLTRVLMGENEDYKSFFKRNEAIGFRERCNGLYNDRLHVDWSIHAEYTIADNIAQGFAEELPELGGRLHIHLAETKKEQEECIQRRGKTPAKWFYDMGFFNVPCYAAHCVWVTEDDMDLMKEKGVSVVHNPSSNMKLGSGFAPIPRMVEKGLNLALGTDGSASNNNLNMFEELHLASIVHNGYTGDPTIMKPETTIKMATVNGSILQGRPDTGALEKGKKADIIALNLDAPHLVPDYDTLALVTYSAQGSDVCMTMVDGRILYENGQYLTMDRERVFHDYRKSCEYLGKE